MGRLESARYYYYLAKSTHLKYVPEVFRSGSKITKNSFNKHYKRYLSSIYT